MNAPFSQPSVHFLNAEPKTVSELVANACDVAIIVDRTGVVKDVAGERRHLARLATDDWRDRHLEEAFGAESWKKLRNAIELRPTDDGPEDCVIEHVTNDDDVLVMRYAAVSTGAGDDTVLLGRDLTPLRTLQDRLLTSQQSIERSLERQRQDEARYRMLFQIASEPIAIVDAQSGKVMETNQAFLDLLGADAKNAVGRRFTALISKPDRMAMEKMLDSVFKTAVPATAQAQLEADGRPVSVRAAMCRVGDSQTFLLHLDSAEHIDGEGAPDRNLIALIERASESVILIDDAGSVLWVNQAFVDLTHGGAVEQILGRSLGDYFDGSELDLGLTLSNVRRHGRLRMLPAKLRGMTGQRTDVELSIVTMPDATPPGFGVVIRNTALRTAPVKRDGRQAGPAEPIEELIGKVPLKELVRDEIDAVEKNCIEAALKLTGNNRAATAKVLGLSRQGLYTKMHRYGLASAEE